MKLDKISSERIEVIRFPLIIGVGLYMHPEQTFPWQVIP